MANVIAIIGESGSGKTTSLRNLPPESTFYIDCDKKGLNWRGWKSQYNKDAKNYYKTDHPQIVLKLLDGINKSEDSKHVKVCVVDTLNAVMVAEEMRNAKVNGFGKWTDLASFIYDIVDYALTMRDDLTVVFICHSETISDDNGVMFTRIKTNGRKLEKIVLESKMTTVLLAQNKDGQYIFKTRADRSTCKTPMGLFEAEEIPNDINIVLKAMEEF